MDWIYHINWITVALAGLFLIPILSGMVTPFSSQRVLDSFVSLIGNLELLISFLLSCYAAKLILANQNGVLDRLYKAIPAVRPLLSGRTALAYGILALLCTLILYGVLRLLTRPVYRFVAAPLSRGIASAVNSMGRLGRSAVGGLWKLPKGVFLALLAALLLNLYASYGGNAALIRSINRSSAYQTISEKALDPLLASGLKKIPILFGDSFQKTVKDLPSKSKQILVVKYFNGMTLDEAVKSDAEINQKAKAITVNAKDGKEKARLLYQWVSETIRYDKRKAEQIAVSSGDVPSGARVAYHTGKGICFDYSCLYVAMCRAAGLKARFVTGLGYSGSEWGDHAWNQVYDPGEDRWINVDTTFGSSGRNYFDRPHFSGDHADAVVQGEW
ncbi:MAG: transglutaminase-like domain-containing protein [Oscillospiraceae bacterium]|nr:transglutaminase-like domain-containing protein [Oscillospiraceae bacterium]